jgi:anti-anti-sigma factor
MSELTISDRDGAIVVMPGKRLDTNTAPEAEKVITARLETGASRIVFDFSGTDYISSAGLRILLKTSKLAGKSGGRVGLCNANDQIREVLEISGFLTMLRHFDNLDEALKNVLE